MLFVGVDSDSAYEKSASTPTPAITDDSNHFDPKLDSKFDPNYATLQGYGIDIVPTPTPISTRIKLSIPTAPTPTQQP